MAITSNVGVGPLLFFFSLKIFNARYLKSYLQSLLWLQVFYKSRHILDSICLINWSQALSHWVVCSCFVVMKPATTPFCMHSFSAVPGCLIYFVVCFVFLSWVSRVSELLLSSDLFLPLFGLLFFWLACKMLSACFLTPAMNCDTELKNCFNKSNGCLHPTASVFLRYTNQLQ